MSEIATLALSGVVGAVTGFLAALLKSALEERVKLDAQLGDVRTPPGNRNADYEVAQRACSALRTAMTNDLLSRRGRGAVFASLPTPRRLLP